ncbi:MAG: 23S rRNA (uracil(1939)-C(5))-methyltransferase RlmD [Proteocatella sp.]
MKKRELIEITVDELKFGGEGITYYEDSKIVYKNGIPGQKVKVLIKKIRKNKIDAKILETVENSPLETEDVCNHYRVCGGCSLLSVPYEKQIELKKNQIKDMFISAGHLEFEGLEMVPSPISQGYKNKMEFTFGNEEKDAPLSLGMHMTTRSNSIVLVDTCKIVDSDYRKILSTTCSYFRTQELPFYKVMSHLGYLRHLVVRKGQNTGEILVNIVTTSQIDFDMSEYVSLLQNLVLDGKIAGILHTINDSYSDAVICDSQQILFGKDYFYDELLGLKFKISPFSFFQTNTKCAEVLYSVTKEMLGDKKDKIVYDLYSGTGTIGIIISENAKEVYGIELIEEAVEMAKENCIANNITNAHYIAGDVATEVSKLQVKPDVIIIDPPRSGVHPKAMRDIISFGAKELIYVSCNPKALVADLDMLKESGYSLIKTVGVDQFPNTPHAECIVLLTK